MKRSLFSLAVGCGLAMALTTSLTGAAAPVPGPIIEPLPADSRDDIVYDATIGMNVLDPGASTTPAVQGTVTLNGSPVEGAEVQAIELLDTDTGTDTVLLGVAYTQADGAYSLEIPTSATEPSPEATITGSYRNIEVVVMDDAYLDVRHFTLFSGPAADGQLFSTSTYDPAIEDSKEVEGPAHISFSLTEDNSIGIDERVSPAVTRRTVIGTSSPWVLVGTFYSTYARNKAKFTTTTGSTSELGLAFSASKVGGYSQKSVVTNTAKSVTDWTSENGTRSRGYQQQWAYNHVRITQCLMKDGYCFKPVYQWEPQGPTAGDKYYTPARPSVKAANCAPRSGTATWSADSQRAMTWSNGVTIRGVIGVDLSSRTGYTTSAKITLSGTGKHRACGTLAKPQAGRVFGQLVVIP